MTNTIHPVPKKKWLSYSNSLDFQTKIENSGAGLMAPRSYITTVHLFL